MAIPDDPDEAFAAKYRRSVAGPLDRFEFFGADPRGITRRHSLDDGYVPLTLNLSDHGEYGTASGGSRADQALRDHRRALVRGVAGSGKSTLLRWLGVDPTRVRGEARHGRAALPFLVELGRYPRGRLPGLAEFVAAPLQSGMPEGWIEGWIERMLAGRRVLLLLDGLDEVQPREREHIEEWVEVHLAAQPDTRCIVTTRPSVVAEQWWVDRGFQRLNLLPMSRHGIEQYVHGWHSVARADIPAGAAAREELIDYERELLATLPNRPALHGMSDNPLLCGLLCALHLERGAQLPEARKQVYDQALDLLLERWPKRRRLHRAATEGETDVGIDRPLKPQELLKLLARLGFWLVTNRQLVLQPDIAGPRVRSCMSGLGKGDEDPERVLRYVAQECGLLRELSDRSLTFVHRTFRDHLAAQEVVEEANLTLMLDNADKPQWHDVVVMAGAHARPAERAWVLRELLARGQANPEHRETLYLLAAAILEQNSVLPPREQHSLDMREQVNAALAALVPPQSSAAADRLATIGPLILDLLPGPVGLAHESAALVVRALAILAARLSDPHDVQQHTGANAVELSGVIEKILPFTRTRSAGVFRQLFEVWGRNGDYETYARDVLRQLDFSRIDAEVQHQRRADHIHHLRTVVALTLLSDVADLRRLTELPRLRRLTLRNNAMTVLDPLAAARSLQVVRLVGCSSRAGTREVDLAPLGGMALRKLEVSGLTTKVDLASLAGARLFSFDLSGSALRGAPALPDGLDVEHLYLSAREGGVDLCGVHGLRTVHLTWVPSHDELAVLARQSDLRRLTLCRVPHDTEAPVLRGVDVVVCTGCRWCS